LPAHSDFRARTHPGTQKPAVPVPREEKQGPTIPPSGQARISPSPLETDESHALAHRPTGPATSGPADQCLRPDVTPVARGIPREVKSARGHHTPFPSCPHRARQAPRAPGRSLASRARTRHVARPGGCWVPESHRLWDPLGRSSSGQTATHPRAPDHETLTRVRRVSKSCRSRSRG
jgi:hypothetical protein